MRLCSSQLVLTDPTSLATNTSNTYINSRYAGCVGLRSLWATPRKQCPLFAEGRERPLEERGLSSSFFGVGLYTSQLLRQQCRHVPRSGRCMVSGQQQHAGWVGTTRDEASWGCARYHQLTGHAFEATHGLIFTLSGPLVSMAAMHLVNRLAGTVWKHHHHMHSSFRFTTLTLAPPLL